MADTDIDPETPLRPLTGFQQGMVAVASVAMGAGMSINFVVVAPLARKAGLTEIQVAGILTLSAAIYALMIPQWGRWADRIGRKRVMVFSLMAMGFTNMAFLFALEAALAGVITGMTMFFTLVFVRIWFGLLSPGLQPASMAATAALAAPPALVVTPPSQPMTISLLAFIHSYAAADGSLPSFRIEPMISFSMARENLRFFSSAPTLEHFSV